MRRANGGAKPRPPITTREINPRLRLDAHRIGDPGSPSDVAGELSVDARNTVDLRAIFVNLVERR
jgi:hypothetical protein